MQTSVKFTSLFQMNVLLHGQSHRCGPSNENKTKNGSVEPKRADDDEGIRSIKFEERSVRSSGRDRNPPCPNTKFPRTDFDEY